MILGLGLRYRPASPAQLEAHQAKIAALIADLLDMPLSPLETACQQWVSRSPYMPKASDLIELAQKAVAPPAAALSAQAWCDAQNASMSPENKRRGIEWYVAGTRDAPETKLRYADTAPDGPPYCTPAEAREILRQHPSSFARAILRNIEGQVA